MDQLKKMESVKINSLTLDPKIAKNGKIYILVQQEDGLCVCWFLDDWVKIKASFDNNKGEYPIQIEFRGNGVLVIKSGPQKTFMFKFSTE